MPRRSKSPGLKRARGRPYWIARQVVRDSMGFPDVCVPLPMDADEERLAALCVEYTERLKAWICAHRPKITDGVIQEPDEPPIPAYDGTMGSACRCYQAHPYSAFRKVKANTRKTYTDSLKVIEGSVGRRLVRNLTVLDFQHWYDMWRKPVLKDGPERIDRAHDAIAMAKTVIRFIAAAYRRPECKALIQELENARSLVRFEKGGAREIEMTSGHAGAFIRKAFELGQRGVIPEWRARYMAIGVAAQFELALRQRDIIGERPKTIADLDKAKRRGATVLDYGGVTWVGWFTWENIPGWRWRMRTSKSKYQAAADFDLTNYGLLLPLLEAVPHDERNGAVVKGEHGHVIQERSYRKWFREIARAAEIPDEVWLMDSRAGAATEAEDAGVSIDLIGESLTHAEGSRTTGRYVRRRASKISEVAKARQAHRKAAGEGGTDGA